MRQACLAPSNVSPTSNYNDLNCAVQWEPPSDLAPELDEIEWRIAWNGDSLGSDATSADELSGTSSLHLCADRPADIASSTWLENTALTDPILGDAVGFRQGCPLVGNGTTEDFLGWLVDDHPALMPADSASSCTSSSVHSPLAPQEGVRPTLEVCPTPRRSAGSAEETNCSASNTTMLLVSNSPSLSPACPSLASSTDGSPTHNLGSSLEHWPTQTKRHHNTEPSKRKTRQACQRLVVPYILTSRSSPSQGERTGPFKCPDVACRFHHRGFPNRKELLRHTLTHSGVRRYHCTVKTCSYARKGFARLDTLKLHEKRKHKVEISKSEQCGKLDICRSHQDNEL